MLCVCVFFFFFQAEDGIRDVAVTGVQTCALPILVGIDVGGGVGSPLGEGWLIDIGLALLMQTSVRNIANADYGIPRELALDGDIPCPGLGILDRKSVV